MYCKKCGKEIREDVKYCPNCGTETSIQTKSGQIRMKKFNISQSWKPCGYIILIGGFFLTFLAIVMFFISFVDVIDELSHYGWDYLSSDEKSNLLFPVFFLILGPFVTQCGITFLKRFICISDEKVYGDLGTGLKGKYVEFTYSEILSVQATSRGGIIIETVKGTYTFTQIESPNECVNLICERLPKA